MLQFLPYALAAYGGYKGYKASKEAGGSGLQRLLGAGTGAALGYYGGKMIPGVTASGSGFTPFTQLGQKFPFLSALPGQVPGQMTGAAAAANTGSFLCLQQLVKFQQQVQQQAHLLLYLVVAYLIFSNHKMLKVKWLMIH